MACNNEDMVQKILAEAKELAGIANEKESYSDSDLLKAAIPETMWNILSRLQSTSGSPIDYYVLSMITAISTAIGDRIAICKNETYKEYAVIYSVMVGAAGDGKSHPIKTVFQQFYEEDQENDKIFQKKMDDFEYRMAISKSKDNDAPFTEKPPVREQNILSDSTFEALVDALKDNPHGFCIVVDELIGLLQDMDRGKNGSKDVMFNSIFNGTQIVVNRKGDKRGVNIARSFASIIGTIQAPLLHKLVDGNKRYNGFFNRFLFAYPKITRRSRWKNNTPTDLGASQELSTIMKFVRERATRLNNAKQSLTITEAAQAILNAWQDENAGQIEKMRAGLLRDSFCKFENYILRFCLILHEIQVAVNGIESNAISPEIAERAISLTKYFKKTVTKVICEMEVKGLNDMDTCVYEALPDEFKKGDGDKIAAEVAGWDTKRLYRFLTRNEGKLFKNTEYSIYKKIYINK